IASSFLLLQPNIHRFSRQRRSKIERDTSGRQAGQSSRFHIGTSHQQLRFSIDCPAPAQPSGSAAIRIVPRRTIVIAIAPAQIENPSQVIANALNVAPIAAIKPITSLAPKKILKYDNRVPQFDITPTIADHALEQLSAGIQGAR